MSASICIKIDAPDRRLIVTAQRRLAAQQEIQRLRVEQTIRPQAPGNKTLTERGSLTLSNITVPLKMDVIHRAAKGRTSSCLYTLYTCLAITSGHTTFRNSSYFIPHA